MQGCACEGLFLGRPPLHPVQDRASVPQTQIVETAMPPGKMTPSAALTGHPRRVAAATVT
jgi:hypothetical protein